MLEKWVKNLDERLGKLLDMKFDLEIKESEGSVRKEV